MLAMRLGVVAMLVVLQAMLSAASADETGQVADWEREGRAKTLEWFRQNWFGVRPSEDRPADEVIASDYVECAGGRIRIGVFCRCPEGACAANPAPVFVFGDHYNAKTSRTKTDTMPGVPTNAIVARGYAFVRWNFNDVTKNDAIGSRGKESANRKLGGMGKTNSWGTISAWAWGFSRVIDWVESRQELDARRIAVIGHSRGGKTALWAGCNDRRVALTISNCSGTGGARYLRLPLAGAEPIAWMKNHSTRHWFCPSWIPTYANREAAVEHDADEMMMLVAPRLLYVASGSDDAWAGPRGEFESARRASGLWEAYGKKGLSLVSFPNPGAWDHSGCVGYHLRKGGHALTTWDWERYMDFMDRHLPSSPKTDMRGLDKDRK